MNDHSNPADRPPVTQVGIDLFYAHVPRLRAAAHPPERLALNRSTRFPSLSASFREGPHDFPGDQRGHVVHPPGTMLRVARAGVSAALGGRLLLPRRLRRRTPDLAGFHETPLLLRVVLHPSQHRLATLLTVGGGPLRIVAMPGQSTFKSDRPSAVTSWMKVHAEITTQVSGHLFNLSEVRILTFLKELDHFTQEVISSIFPHSPRYPHPGPEVTIIKVPR